jgi:N-acetylglucosamine-6-phosphate deacetylase
VRSFTGVDPATGDLLDVTVSGSVITGIRRGPRPPETGIPWIAPGLVDLQVNGFRGLDLNDGALTADTLRALRNELLSVGVTTFVPTLITNSGTILGESLRVIAEARSRDRGLARSIPFVHLEGPYISAEDGPRGCHDPAWVRPPDLAEFAEWQRVSGDLIGMITLSPHWDGAAEFVAAVTAQNVRVSIGHTHAAPEQIRSAIDAGASTSTHLGNGAHALIARHPNYIWTQLADDRIDAGFIADGHHLSRDALTVMLRAKGTDHSFLVSDLAALAGMQPGRYTAPVGGDVEVTEDGRLVSYGTPFLAGATATLADGVARAANLPGVTLGDAVKLATANPGRIVDPRGSCGRLVVGGRADIVTFAWNAGETSLREVASWSGCP